MVRGSKVKGVAGRPPSVETIRRRSIVKRLVLERNITDHKLIRSLLESEFGIVVSTTCVFRDLKNLGGVRVDELREFEKEKLVSEDDFYRGKDDLQDLTNRFTEQMDEISARKQREVIEG